MRHRAGGLRAYLDDPALTEIRVVYTDYYSDEEQNAMEEYVREWRKRNRYMVFYFCINESEVTTEILFFRTPAGAMNFKLGWNFEQKI